MSASKASLAIASLGFGVAAIGGCGSHPPGYADHEALAFDVEGCITGDGCSAQGGVTAVESLAPGDHAIYMPQGSSITATLNVPNSTWRLGHLVIGLRGVGGVNDARVMTVAVTGTPVATFEPVAGLARIDVEELDATPAAGAQVTISAAKGAFAIEWVVARWDDP